MENIRKKMKEIPEEIFISICDKTQIEYFHSEDFEPEEIKSCSGFIMFPTIAFISPYRATMLSSFEGSGMRTGNKKIDAKIESMIDYNYTYAKEGFTKENETWIKENNLSDDQLNYSDLYELGHGDKAEELSEIENDCISDNFISMTLQFFYYAPDNYHSDYCNSGNKENNGSFLIKKVFYFDEYNKVNIDEFSNEIPVPLNCNDLDMEKLIDKIKEDTLKLL